MGWEVDSTEDMSTPTLLTEPVETSILSIFTDSIRRNLILVFYWFRVGSDADTPEPKRVKTWSLCPTALDPESQNQSPCRTDSESLNLKQSWTPVSISIRATRLFILMVEETSYSWLLKHIFTSKHPQRRNGPMTSLTWASERRTVVSSERGPSPRGQHGLTWERHTHTQKADN